MLKKVFSKENVPVLSKAHKIKVHWLFTSSYEKGRWHSNLPSSLPCSVNFLPTSSSSCYLAAGAKPPRVSSQEQQQKNFKAGLLL